MNGEDKDDMREQADWMVIVDERILEYLRDEDVGTPKKIAERIDKHNNYIGERCRELTRYGLLNKIDRGVYVISDKGEKYLEEELDASQLEPRD